NGVKLKPYLTQVQKLKKSLAEFSESGIIVSYSKSISNSDKDLLPGVDQMAVEAAMRIFNLSKNFPKEVPS
ncbi:hypothetical protein DRQ11_11650, partial [candidate division KSB1 bacterium]